MDKKSMKKLIIIIAVAGALFAALGVTAAVGMYKMIMRTDTQSDQYLEQLLEAAEKGDDFSAASLYMIREGSREEIEGDIQTLFKVWNRAQPYTYKKIGYRMNSSTANGEKVKVFTSNYIITTAEGEKLEAVLRREERGEGSGITVFHIAPRESVKPVGRLGTMDRWSLIQWLLFAFSLMMIAGTVVTAVDCYRRKPQCRWGWIALILLAYASPGFSLLQENGRRMLRVQCSATLVGFSKLVVYPDGGVIFRLLLPAGMVIYWIMRKRLTPPLKGESQL